MTPALVLTGPTASGKTEVGLAVAEALGAEILAMDSATVYRGLDIGTAKPTAAQRARARHHLLDIAEPAGRFTVADWLHAAATAEADVASRSRTPLYLGGTPLYLKALLYGLFESPDRDPELRSKLEAIPDLHAAVAKVDAAAAARLHPNDRKRLVRALEVHALTGKPLSEQQGQWGEAGRAARIVWLDPPREVLRERIRARAAAMLAGGLVEEARSCVLSREARAVIGYGEALDLAAGTITRDEALERICARTWTLVRRQTTWLKKLAAGALRLTGTDPVDAARRATAWLAGAGKSMEPGEAPGVQG